MTTRAWVAWAVTVTVFALTVTNPLYLALAVLGVTAVGSVAPMAPGAEALRPLLLAGLGLVIFSGLVAAVNGTPGTEVLFTVPGPDAPSWLGGLRFGGPVTTEGLIAASTRALALLAIFGAFAILTTSISPSRLLRATPAALFQAGLVLTIGLSILPATIADAQRLREAELLRGRNLRWWHLPTLLPTILLGGLERSVRVAEALEARGFGGGSVSPAAFLAGAAAPPAFLFAAYFWIAGGDSQIFALALGLLGAVGFVWWLLAAGAANRSTRLVSESDRPVELVSIGIATTAIAFALMSHGFGPGDIRYDPFTGSTVPPVTILGAVVTLFIAWPFLALLARNRDVSEAVASEH